MLRHIYALGLGLLLAACSDPKCPRTMVQVGNTCRKCEPGFAPKGGVCKPVDGDGGVDDDAEVDEDAEVGWDEDAEIDGEVAGDASVEFDATSETDADVDASAPCYLDMDGDGVGAGEPVACTNADADAGDGGVLVSFDNTDCDDNDPQRSPRLTDICGDSVDNDCDGQVDDESNNACGGSCTVQLANQPGDTCTNGLLGACARTGKYECSANALSTVCNAPNAFPSTELCGDGVDNDCDGYVDEADASDAKTWFVDCDRDGYAPSTEGSVKSCGTPADANNCAWTNTIPVARSTQDCDDTSSVYKPGAAFQPPPAGKTSTDVNCDGVEEKPPFMWYPNTFWAGTFLEMKICSSSLGCQSCRASQGDMAGRWNVSGAVPSCSTSYTDYRTCDVTYSYSIYAPPYCESTGYFQSTVCLHPCR